MYDNGNSEFGRSITLSGEECSTKLDLGQIICPKVDRGDRCILHSRYGSRIDSCNDVKSGDAIFTVPLGRLFIWPTFYVGHIAKVTHISLLGANEQNHRSTSNKDHDVIEIETISVNPKVFKIRNFFTTTESEQLIATALTMTGKDHMLKRSSTGSDNNVDNYRTSENAFDTGSPQAKNLKKRVFELLGIFPYEEMMADGLQVLRYNQTTAYRDHLGVRERERERPCLHCYHFTFYDNLSILLLSICLSVVHELVYRNVLSPLSLSLSYLQIGSNPGMNQLTTITLLLWRERTDLLPCYYICPM